MKIHQESRRAESEKGRKGEGVKGRIKVQATYSKQNINGK
jgi:hypothetical protein